MLIDSATAPITAIVLCAGRGQRLSPHTDSIPKPLLPVHGKPTLDFIFAALQRAGIKRVVMVTNYLSDQLEAYARKQTYFAVDCVACAKQQALSGTADATMAALAARPDWFKTAFLLTASDYIVPLDFYRAFLHGYRASGKSIAISLKHIDHSELAMRSSVRLDDHDDVLEVVEKPAIGTAPSRLSANLIFVLPPDIVDKVKAVPASPRGEKEVQSAINSYLHDHGPACGVEQAMPQEWQPAMR